MSSFAPGVQSAKPRYAPRFLCVGAFARFFINKAFGEIGEIFVRALLFADRFLEQLERLVIAEPFGPSTKASISRDLVMLHFLRRANESGIKRRKPRWRTPIRCR